MPAQLLLDTTSDYTHIQIDLNENVAQISYAISAPYSAAYQIAKTIDKTGKPEWDLNDLLAQPGTNTFANIYGIRFKSYDPANPTTVSVTVFYKDDPIPLGFVPGTGIFNTGGSVIGGQVVTGAKTVFWPGGTPQSGLYTVPHSLGVIPRVVICSVGACANLGSNSCIPSTFAYTATDFQLEAFTNGLTSPSSAGQADILWLASL